MSLHRLTQIVMGVPNVEETAGYYTEFGLAPRMSEEVSVWGVATSAPTGDHTFSTVDGGEQLRIVDTFSEYYSDLDCIVEDELWQPRVWEDATSLWAWGTPPPASFLAPEDLAGMMTGTHAAAR